MRPLLSAELLIVIIDKVLSLLGIIVTLPILILSALAIYLEDGHSPFFIQRRFGKNLKPFNIIKLRSMETNILFSESERKVTRIGYLLRRTSIDELPQLLNVLKGDMSLVGVRPDLYLDENKNNRHLLKRNSFKPGLTGLSQIKGRSSLSERKRRKYDLFWNKKISIELYFYILFKTPLCLLNQKNVN